MARLSVAPPLTFSHSPLFTIAVERHLSATLLVPPGAAMEAAFGLVRITPASVALPPLTLSALEPPPLAVSVPPVMVRVPPVTSAAWVPAPDVVTVVPAESVIEPALSACTPRPPPPVPTEMLTPVAVMALFVPVAKRPVFPPPPENVTAPPLSWILPPACALAAVMPPELPIDRVRPSAMMRLPAPSANKAEGMPPLDMVIVEVAVNWISPPANACTKLCPPPLGQITVTLFATIVALLARMAIAPPPPSFDSTMLFAMIVLPLAASSPRPLAVTGPLTVTKELVSALIPVPNP